MSPEAFILFALLVLMCAIAVWLLKCSETEIVQLQERLRAAMKGQPPGAFMTANDHEETDALPRLDLERADPHEGLYVVAGVLGMAFVGLIVAVAWAIYR